MAGKRKSHSAAFKAQVALAALKGDKTINELASQHGVHPTLIHGWKKQLLTGAEAVFASGAKGTGPPGRQDDRVVRADRPPQGGTRLGEKKIGRPRLRPSVPGSRPSTRS